MALMDVYCCIREQMEVFKMNGFDFQEAADGRLLLVSVPFSKNTTFGVDDVQELLTLLDGGSCAPMAIGAGQAPSRRITRHDIVRPSR